MTVENYSGKTSLISGKSTIKTLKMLKRRPYKYRIGVTGNCLFVIGRLVGAVRLMIKPILAIYPL